MIAPWLILAAALAVPLVVWRRQIAAVWSEDVTVVTGPDGERIEKRHKSWVPELGVAGGVLAALTIGAVAFLGGGGALGLAIMGGRTASGTTSAFQYGAPNTPTGSVVVIDTSTVYFLASAFVGSGDDTQDSVRFAITRLAADTTAILTEVKTATTTNNRDTISDNTNLKADTTYKGYFKRSGVNGNWSAWSAPDTFVNNLLTIDTIAFLTWATALGDTDNAQTDGSKIASAAPCGSDPDSVFKVVTAASTPTGYTHTTNMVKFLVDVSGCFHAGTAPMFPTLGTGGTWVYALDFANGVGQTADIRHGTFDHHDTGNIEAVTIRPYPLGGGNWRHIIGFGRRINGSGGPEWWNLADTLLADTMYTVHVRVEILSDSTYRFYPNLYRARDGLQIAGPNDYKCFNNCDVANRGLKDWYALGADSVLKEVTTGSGNVRDLSIGQGTAGGSGEEQWYACWRIGTAVDTASYWPSGTC